MSLNKHVILGIHITDRVHNVASVQQILTEYGCSIRTRIGLHEADENFCSPNGVVILEMVGTDQTHDEMIAKLNALEGIEAKKMTFDHP